MQCVTTLTLHVFWNGRYTEYFVSSRGVRQRDPMSPYLFVLTMERLGHSIKQVVFNENWQLIALGRG